jgi:protein-S-isoprenylcysteine O-methyltransferase Ste14
MFRAFPGGAAVPDTPEAHLVGLFWSVFVVTWVLAALFTKRTVERSNSFWGLAVALMIGAFFAVRRIGIADTVLWTYTQTLGLTADAIVGFGLFFALWARFALGRNWSGQVTFKQDHELITTGPYSLARHPIYTGMIMMLLGTAILVGHAMAFWLTAIFTLTLWIKAGIEEQLMMKHFPDAYPAYRSRVRALIPFVL